MKKTMKMMLVFMAGAMISSACSSEDDDALDSNKFRTYSAIKPMTLIAVQEEPDTNRAAISGVDIQWVDGDAISIFDGSKTNNGNQKFSLTAGAGTTSGTFSGYAAESETYCALYPYMASQIVEKQPTQEEAENAAFNAVLFSMFKNMWDNTYEIDKWMAENTVRGQMSSEGIPAENQAIIIAYLKGEKLQMKVGPKGNGDKLENVTFPAEQTVVAGQSVDSKAMLMMGKISERPTDKVRLEFKNICAYVKVTPKFDCAAIAIRSNGTENLAGTVTIDYNNGAPTTNITASGSNDVLLTGSIKANNAYYIAVLPETLNSGFTIEFLTADKQHYYARSTNKPLDLARNKLINLGDFETTGTWTENTSIRGTASNGEDWLFISPTLRIAIWSPFNSDYENAIDYQNQWGPDWVLLSEADIQAHRDVFSSGDTRIYFNLRGVLKLTSSRSIPFRSLSIWLSDPTDDESMGTALKLKDFATYDALKTDELGVIYKYIGE